MRYLLAITLIIFGSSASAEPITPEEIRSLVLDRKFQALEQAMSSAQGAFEAGQTNAEHLRDLNMVFVTTSPIIQEATEEWLEAYPDSVYAIMANAWIANKIAWTIRGTGYAHTVYQDAWPAFYAASDKAAQLTLSAFSIDPTYLPASDGMIAQGTFGNVDVNVTDIVDAVMAQAPNAGTLTRGLIVAHKGWGGSYTRGEKMCEQHAHKITAWGDQAFDICMIHLAFQYNGWKPLDAFIERLLHTDHSAISQIRHQVMIKTPLLDPEHIEGVSDAEFPFEKWQNELLRELWSPDFDDLELAISYDGRFAQKPHISIVSDRVRETARENAKRVLEYDPYNVSAIETLLNIGGFKPGQDGRKKYYAVTGLNSPSETLNLYKRLAIAQPWNAEHWSNLSHTYAGPPHSKESFWKKRILERNYLAYSNHAPERLWEFIETNLYFVRSYNSAQKKEPQSKLPWISDLDPSVAFYCPIARASALLSVACENPRGSQNEQACWSADFQKEQLETISNKIRTHQDCPTAISNNIEGWMFKPIEFEADELSVFLEQTN
ncbi:DUF4034 domain-containing protein [Cognatishimia activa]|uniref:DUF4034 domain-containing protein n=1 Tax=Cognatishimia activa TaxID=1715691 RepID=UPI00222F5ED4|nr:DUF4034 domain-containing protein [Cognatishimia activa]UZD89913.1 DUF4034 domain-containing protein [Cognatishimia activa]